MPTGEPARPWLPRWLLALAGIGLVGYGIYLLRGVLTPLLIAVLLAYLLDPVVDRLERWRIPRGPAIAVLLGAFLLTLTAVTLLVVPRAVRESVDFFRQLPRRFDATWQQVEPWLVAQGVVVPTSFKELQAQLGDHVGDFSQRAAVAVGEVASWVATSTASVVGAVVTLFLIPVLTFYILYDFDRMCAAALDLVPWSYRRLAREIARDIDAVIAQFIRGQLVVMALLAVAYSVAYSAVGVPLAVVIGMLAGAVSFIPHVGGAVALGTALLACALSGTSWLQVGGVVVLHLTIQWIEGFVVTPRIMAGQVGLPAVWVILALLGFGELFGFLGVVLAVPAAAVIKTLLVRVIGAYKESELYGAAPATGDGGVVPALDPESVAAAISQRPPPAPPAFEAEREEDATPGVSGVEAGRASEPAPAKRGPDGSEVPPGSAP